MQVIQLDHSGVLNILPDRDPDTHKGNYGKVLLLCGSRGYTGAAALAAMGALRCGAGLVYLGVPESIYEIEAIKLNEPIVFPLPEENGQFSSAAIGVIQPMLEQMDAILIGPGCGRGSGVFALVQFVLAHFQGPVIVDADGINVLQTHKDILRGRTNSTILTPHDGEFVRIGGVLNKDRIASAEAASIDLNSIVLLKGHRTVITDGKTCYINPTGNPGMAVGGCGDLLSGMIVGLLGQGIAPLSAAASGAWLHGAAGDLCAEQLGQYDMLPTDMLNVLPRLMK